jgi:hypothetical protein
VRWQFLTRFLFWFYPIAISMPDFDSGGGIAFMPQGHVRGLSAAVRLRPRVSHVSQSWRGVAWRGAAWVASINFFLAHVDANFFPPSALTSASLANCLLDPAALQGHRNSLLIHHSSQWVSQKVSLLRPGSTAHGLLAVVRAAPNWRNSAGRSKGSCVWEHAGRLAFPVRYED